MPSSATITSFYTFTSGTKARSAYVNANFNNFRGHVIPIDPNTAASSDMTYDAGATDAAFRAGYFGSVNIRSTGTSFYLALRTAALTANTAMTFPIQTAGLENGAVTLAKTTSYDNYVTTTADSGIRQTSSAVGGNGFITLTVAPAGRVATISIVPGSIEAVGSGYGINGAGSGIISLQRNGSELARVVVEGPDTLVVPPAISVYDSGAAGTSGSCNYWVDVWAPSGVVYMRYCKLQVRLQ